MSPDFAQILSSLTTDENYHLPLYAWAAVETVRRVDRSQNVGAHEPLTVIEALRVLILAEGMDAVALDITAPQELILRAIRETAEGCMTVP